MNTFPVYGGFLLAGGFPEWFPPSRTRIFPPKLLCESMSQFTLPEFLSFKLQDQAGLFYSAEDESGGGNIF